MGVMGGQVDGRAIVGAATANGEEGQMSGSPGQASSHPANPLVRAREVGGVSWFERVSCP